MSIHMGKEDLEQATLFEWLEYNETRLPQTRFIFAVPNGGYRPIPTAIRLKRTGLRKGSLDIFIPFPSANGQYHFGAIEMKIHPNKPSKEQLEYIEFINSVGGLALICYSAEEAIQTIESYLGS